MKLVIGFAIVTGLVCCAIPAYADGYVSNETVTILLGLCTLTLSTLFGILIRTVWDIKKSLERNMDKFDDKFNNLDDRVDELERKVDVVAHDHARNHPAQPLGA